MRYKLRYIVLPILVASTFACHAQCPSDKRQLDIQVSQGFITGSQLTVNSGNDDKAITSNSGTTFITLRYFLYNRLSIGLTGGVNSEQGLYRDRYTPSIITSTYKQDLTTVAVEVYYIYFFRKYLEVYTLLGVGPSFSSITTTTNPTPYTAGSVTTAGTDVLKLQYTPVGIRFGGRIGGFAEFGIGYKGVVNAGLSFKIGPSCWWRK